MRSSGIPPVLAMVDLAGVAGGRYQKASADEHQERQGVNFY